MKQQMKIMATLSLLWILVLFRQPLAAESAYDYTNRSCGFDNGRDIVFVLQDTIEMQKQDPNQDRIHEVVRLVDQAEGKDRFGIVGFHTELTGYSALTTNRWESKAALQTLTGTPVGNGIDVSVGLEKAIQDFTDNPSANDKIIVLMTVGKSIDNERL